MLVAEVTVTRELVDAGPDEWALLTFRYGGASIYFDEADSEDVFIEVVEGIGKTRGSLRDLAFLLTHPEIVTRLEGTPACER